MFFNAALALLFFLPTIESFSRPLGFNVLFFSGILIGIHLIRLKKISYDLIDYVWIIMLIVFSVSSFFSWSILRSIPELVRYYIYYLIFLSIRNFGEKNTVLRKYYVFSIIINSFILSLLALVFFFFNLQPHPSPTSGMNLFYKTFSHNHISDILILAIPLFIFLSIRQREFYKKSMLILLSLFFTQMLFFSWSRGALLSLSLSFFVFIYIFRSKFIVTDFFNLFIRLLGIITFIILIFSFTYPVISPETPDNLLKFYYKLPANENRLNFYYQAGRGFLESPIIGTGLDTFRFISLKYEIKNGGWSWYTHNHFLEMLQETGFIGGTLFFSLISLIFYKIYKQYNGNDGILVGIIASSLLSLLDYNWQFYSIMLFFWMGTALLMPEQEKYEY